MWRFAFCLLFATPALALAGPKVTVVVGNNAPALEKLAAQNLSADLHALFAADVIVQSSMPAAGGPTIVLGSPATNAAIPANDWPPHLSDQGHVLKSTPKGLILGGTSPKATLWAVSEFSYHFGMRHLLQGDVLPIDKPPFNLDGINSVFDTQVKSRAWDAFNGQASGLDGWAEEDCDRLMAQLVRLKFTHLVLPKKPAPFASLTVNGDSAGRTAFKGAKFFANADVAAVVEKLRAKAPALGLDIMEAAPSPQDVIHLGGATNSVLPQFALQRLRTDLQGRDHIIVQAVVIGDLNAPANLVSRSVFDGKITAENALADLVTPICGEGVAERLWKGFSEIEKADALIAKNAPTIGVPDAKVYLRHLQSKEALPAWLTEAKTLYTSAMNEMYRANTRARDGARPFILYHAKRLEFAMDYFIVLESLYKAHDAAQRDESMEAAVEASYNSLNAYADVARDASDRGVIALLNEHGYHVLTKSADAGGKAQ